MRAVVLLASASLFAVSGAAFGQSIDQLWRNNCLSCHGENGEGGGAGTRTLLTDEWLANKFDLQFFDAIKKGHVENGMPAFGEALSDAQMWSLVVYIREKQEDAWRSREGSISKKAKDGEYATKLHSYTLERVITRGLEVPWSIRFMPDGKMLVANRPGELLIHSTGREGGTVSKPVAGTPKVRNQGQGGLMEATLHPDFAKQGNGWIYLGFADPGSSDSGMTKIVRGRITGADTDSPKWSDEQTIFEAKPESYTTGPLHWGNRIAFDPKDSSTLFFSIGERGRMDHAQDLTRPNGKVHRIKDDGTIPQDNPFVGKKIDGKPVYESIWSYGHRNPQGLVFDLTGALWDTEHGPRGGDELNLIERGKNYGWPIVSFGINYQGTPFRQPFPDLVTANADAKDIVMPTFVWTPSIGACGLDVVRPGANGEAFPKWKGDLVAGGLSGANVDRIRVAKDAATGAWNVVEREEIFHGFGRVRDVVVAPDGSVYVVLNGPDHVVRLAPK